MRPLLSNHSLRCFDTLMWDICGTLATKSLRTFAFSDPQLIGVTFNALTNLAVTVKVFQYKMHYLVQHWQAESWI